jgi:hypothetical protein
LLGIGTVALLFGSEIIDWVAQYGGLSIRIVVALAEQISVPQVAFALLSLILMAFLLIAGVMWLLAGDPQQEMLWQQNWPNGYRDYGYLDIGEGDSEPMMRIFRLIGEEEVDGRWERPSYERYSPPVATRGASRDTVGARTARASTLDDPTLPVAFDEGRMPSMVRNSGTA